MPLAPSDILASRLARLRRSLQSAGCEALIVTRRPNVFYLSNFGGSAGLLLVTPSRFYLILDFRYLTDARRLLASVHGPRGATLVPVETSYDEALAALLASAAPAVVGFEAEHVSFARHAWLNDHLSPATRLEPTRRLVEALRERKDAHEVGVLRAAARALSALVPGIVEQVKPGRAERDVAAAIEAAMRSSGFSKPAFDTIVGSGPNGALPHATAGERAIQRGDLVVLDFGGVLDGYCVDMTRTVSVGPPGPEARRVYQAVRAAQRAAIEAVRPGVPTDEIDAAARSVLDRAGLGGAFGHGTGHGLGLEVHEDPRITRRARGAGATAAGPVAVAAGMVFTIEPGAYLPDWGGVRIEDDVLVTEEGCEVLTRGADVDGPFFST
jgi:Xaa-Pro aminopeptidase